MHKRSNFVRQNQKLFRPEDPLLQVFVWGIRHVIAEMEYIPPPTLLLNDDFKAFTKMVSENSNYNSTHYPSHFKFKEYAPLVYRNLRERFGISIAKYVKSLVRGKATPCSCSGKGTAVMYVTEDKLFTIKSISAEENDCLQRFIQPYHEHVVSMSNRTFLSRLMGSYRVTVQGKERYLIVMNNVTAAVPHCYLKYDLKGSTFERIATEKEKEKDCPTLKDLDFNNANMKLKLEKEKREALMQILKDDVEFLKKQKVMDYSLLISIGKKADNEVSQIAEKMSESGPIGGEQADIEENALFQTLIDFYKGEQDDIVYSFGIIDILTYYSTKKHAAHTAKTMKHGVDANISSVNPNEYGKRFLAYVEEVFE